jgi:CRP-like cAMP-binding protein
MIKKPGRAIAADNLEPGGAIDRPSPATIAGVIANQAHESMVGAAPAFTGRPMFLSRPDRLPSELRAMVTHRELIAGETLYHRGDPAVAIFAVERGRVQLLSHTSEGKPVPLYVVRPGECVSEAALFAESYCGNVVAEVLASPREKIFGATPGGIPSGPGLRGCDEVSATVPAK